MYLLLVVLRTGVETVFAVDNTWKVLGEINHVRHVNDAANIDSAMADKHSDSRRLVADVFLRGIFFFLNKCAPRLGKQFGNACRGGAGLNNRLRDVFGLTYRPASKDTLTACVLTGKRLRIQETELVNGQTHNFLERINAFRCDKRS